MHQTRLLFAIATWAFAACPVFADSGPSPDNASASATPTATATAESVKTARLRLFGQNGTGVVFYKNSACDGGTDSVRVSGGLGSAFSSFLGSVKNESIGIPETETTKRLQQRDGILSKAYFKEYEIDPGKPVTVAMGFNDAGMRRQCRLIAATFLPEAGLSYEGRLDLDMQAGLCRFVVNRVADDGGLSAVALAPASACK